MDNLSSEKKEKKMEILTLKDISVLLFVGIVCGVVIPYVDKITDKYVDKITDKKQHKRRS